MAIDAVKSFISGPLVDKNGSSIAVANAEFLYTCKRFLRDLLGVQLPRLLLSYQHVYEEQVIGLPLRQLSNIFFIISSPTLIHQSTDSETSIILRQSYSQLVTFLIDDLLPDLSHVFFRLLEFDESDISLRSTIHSNPLILSLQEDQSLNPDLVVRQRQRSKPLEKPQRSNIKYPKKTFRRISAKTDQIASDCELICQTIISITVSHTNNLRLTRHLLQHFRSIASNPKHPDSNQAILILCFLAKSLGKALHSLSHTLEKKKRLDIQQLVLSVSRELADMLQDQDQDQDHSSSPLSSSASPSSSSWSIIRQSLILQAIGSCAETLGNKFEDLLMDSILVLLQKLGSEYEHVSESAWITLLKASEACGCKDLPHLIDQNIDYIIDRACYQMKYLDLYPETPQIFRGLLIHTELSTILPLISDSLDVGPFSFAKTSLCLQKKK